MKILWGKQITPKSLEGELNMAGLFAYHDYAKMGHSGDEWRTFRIQIATELLKRLDVYQKK